MPDPTPSPRTKNGKLKGVSRMLVHSFKKRGSSVFGHSDNKTTELPSGKLTSKEVTDIMQMVDVLLRYVIDNSSQTDIPLFTTDSLDSKMSIDTVVATGRHIAAGISTLSFTRENQFFAFLNGFQLQQISMVIKLTFKLSEEPFFNSDMANRVVEIVKKMHNKSTTEDMANALRDCVRALEPARLNVLRLLCEALKGAHQTLDSLAYAFGPILFMTRRDIYGDKKMDQKQKDTYSKLMADMDHLVHAIEFMVEHHDMVFNVRVKSLSREQRKIFDPSFSDEHKIASHEEDGDEDDDDDTAAPLSALVKFDFVKENDEELQLYEGQVIEVLDQDDDGWWFGRNQDGEEGIFPETYVEIVVEDQETDEQQPPTKCPHELLAELESTDSTIESKEAGEPVKNTVTDKEDDTSVSAPAIPPVNGTPERSSNTPPRASTIPERSTPVLKSATTVSVPVPQPKPVTARPPPVPAKPSLKSAEPRETANPKTVAFSFPDDIANSSDASTSALQSENEQLREQLNAITHSRDKLEKENGDIRFEMEEMHTTVSNLKLQLRDIKDEVGSSAARHSDTDRADTLQTQLDEAKKELYDLKQSMKLETSQGEKLSGKASALEAENKKLQQQLKESVDLVSQLSQQLDALEGDRQSASSSQELVAGLERELECFKVENKVLKDTVKMDQDKYDHHEELFLEKIAQLEKEFNTVKEQLDEAQNAPLELEGRLKKEMAERKRLHNALVELKGNIRVLCRVRPKLRDDGDCSAAFFPGSGTIDMSQPGDNTAGRSFRFDEVFPPTAEQHQVYGEVAPLVKSAMDGSNVTILAYGQTGSGKTHTMEGSPDDQGVIPRSLGDAFQYRDEQGDVAQYSFKMTVLEVHNEKIHDLLVEAGIEKKDLDIRQSTQGIYVQGITEVSVASVEEAVATIESAKANRSTGSHDYNARSSRSHLVVSISIERTGTLASGNDQPTKSKLTLIDLAGSERLAKTNATGSMLTEAKSINKSLSALGDVISALATKKSFVPFRNSKLTWLLSDSLCAGSKVAMIVTASPNALDYDETLCTLKFAKRCARVEFGGTSPPSLGARSKSTRSLVTN